MRTFEDPYTVDLRRAVDTILEARVRFSANMAVHTTISMIGSSLFDQITAIADAAGPEHSASQLVTGHGMVEETRIAADLWAVSRGTPNSRPSSNSTAIKARTPDSCTYECGGRTRRRFVLVETYAELPDARSPAILAHNQTASRHRAEAALLQALPAHRRVGTRTLLALAARFVPHRESGKAGYLMAVDGALSIADR